MNVRLDFKVSHLLKIESYVCFAVNWQMKIWQSISLTEMQKCVKSLLKLDTQLGISQLKKYLFPYHRYSFTYFESKY